MGFDNSYERIQTHIQQRNVTYNAWMFPFFPDVKSTSRTTTNSNNSTNNTLNLKRKSQQGSNNSRDGADDRSNDNSINRKEYNSQKKQYQQSNIVKTPISFPSGTIKVPRICMGHELFLMKEKDKNGNVKGPCTSNKCRPHSPFGPIHRKTDVFPNNYPLNYALEQVDKLPDTWSEERREKLREIFRRDTTFQR